MLTKNSGVNKKRPPRKKKKRNTLTQVSGITLKAYKEHRKHRKSPPICYVYTLEELKLFAKERGMEISE